MKEIKIIVFVFFSLLLLSEFLPWVLGINKLEKKLDEISKKLKNSNDQTN